MSHDRDGIGFMRRPGANQAVMKYYPDFRLLEPKRWLLEGSRTGYYLLDGNLDESIKLAVAAINAWRVAHAAERTKWNQRKSSKQRINRMVLEGPFLLQRILFEKAVPYEKFQELQWKEGKLEQSPQTLYTRYVKHLILQALYRLSFHMLVAQTQILRTYGDDQAATIYNFLRPSLTEAAQRQKKIPYVEAESYEEWRETFFEDLISRFSKSNAFLITRPQKGWERHFEMLSDPSGFAGFIRDALELFTPWGIELTIGDKFNPDGPEQKKFQFEGSRLIDELPLEFKRVAVLINPGSFDKIIESFGYENADSKLQLPQLNGAMRKSDEDDMSLKPFPGLDQEQTESALEEVARSGHERKQLRASTLNLEIDGTGIKTVFVKLRPWLTRVAGVSVHLEPDARTIELYALPHDGGRRVQVSYLSLPATGITQGIPWQSIIELEGGQSVLLKIYPELAEGKRFTGSTLKLFYREQFSFSNLILWLKECLTLHPEPIIIRRWVGMVAAIILFYFASLAVHLYRGGKIEEMVDLWPWRWPSRSSPIVPTNNNEEGGKEIRAQSDQQNNRQLPEPSPVPSLNGGAPEAANNLSERRASIKEDRTIPEINDGRLIIKGNNQIEGLSYYGTQFTYSDLFKESFLLPAAPITPIPASEQTMSGEQVRTTLRVVYPNGVTVRSVTPTLTWKTTRSGGSFVISVYDEDPKRRYDPLQKSSVLTGTEWTLNQPLERGRDYTWQVEQLIAASGNQSNVVAEGRFRVLSETELRSVEAAEAVTPRSHLVMAHLYARAGLLKEAENELQQLKAENPKSRVVDRLLRSIRGQLSGKTKESK